MSWLSWLTADGGMTQAEAKRIHARAAAGGLTVRIEARIMPTPPEPPSEACVRVMEPEAGS
jgi:hypothetical protein